MTELHLLHQSFAAQSVRTPDATAVEDEHARLSYADLEQRSNRLAYFLRGQGVQPESVVGICLTRGVDLVVAMLATWKAGGAYLPIDPHHPAERNAGMLLDSGTQLVLVDAMTDHLLSGSGVRQLTIGEHAMAGSGWSGRAPVSEVCGTNAAYIVYTSGSTGRPKGVVVTHDGIGNRVRWTVERHGLASTDRMLQKSSIAFDAAALEIFAPLISGGTVVLPPPGVERSAELMAQTLAARDITILQGVPSVLRLLAAEPAWSRATPAAPGVLGRRAAGLRTRAPAGRRTPATRGVEHLRPHRMRDRRHGPAGRRAGPERAGADRATDRRDVGGGARRAVGARSGRRRRRALRSWSRRGSRLQGAARPDRGAVRAEPVLRRRVAAIRHR